MAEPAGTARVYLHVGVPKTGTTFIQDVLWRGRNRLARDGVCYPLRRRSEHFAATMDLRGASWGGRHNPEWDGTWDRLAATVAESGAAIGLISGELLAAADRAAVARAVASFPDREVHVVLTVRDLARQLVSGWQEQVKHRVSVPLDDFVAGCLGDPSAGERARRLAERFWQLHDIGEVAQRWSSAVPADRLHLATVPPQGAGRRGELWERFAAVTHIDPDLGRVDTARPNASLGAAEAEFLRRYNSTRAGGISPPHYDQVVRALLAEKVLAGANGPPLGLPGRFADAVHERSAQLVGTVAAGGYDVVGDLDDLLPDADALRSTAADVVDDASLAEVSVRATTGLLTELGPLQRRLRSRHGRARPTAAGTAARPRRGGRLPGGSSEQDVPPGPVFMHVGAPKTGTTYLQDLMWHRRHELAGAGVRFVRRRYGDHYQASLDLREVRTRPPEAQGMWARVAAGTMDWPGPSVISHELFAAARPAHVARALDSLGPGRVHVVYTVRDLWGLLAAEWQESTKHGRSLSFEQYLHDVLDRRQDGVVGGWFWSVHDAVGVLERWGHDLPPERVHVITVPPAGADPDLLWARFAGVVGIDPTAVAVPGVADPVRPNESLGSAEVTFLRLVNERLGGRDGALPAGEHAGYVKSLLAQQILAGRPGKTRYAPPPERFALVSELAQQQVAGLRAAGYRVVGDLDDLLPSQPGAAGGDPDQVAADLLVEVGLDAVAGLVQRAVRMRNAHGRGNVPQAPQQRAGGLRGRLIAAGRAVRRTVEGKAGKPQ
ncbi:hypothetical protein BH20ACT6_BH20ACT6_06260 [soil metagenome]